MCFAVLGRFRHVPLSTTPWDCSPQGSSVHRIPQTRILEWVVYALLQGIFPDPALVSCIAGRFFTDWATREAPSARCQSINEMLRRSLCSVTVISLSGTALPQNFLTSSTRSILAPNTAAVKPRMGRLSYEQYIAQQDSWKAPCTAFWGWLSTEHRPLLLCPTDSTLFICSEHCCVLPELSKTTRFCSESGNMS